MTVSKPGNLWTSTNHVHDDLERADSISHRDQGESALLEFIPRTTPRVLDLGTGDGDVCRASSRMFVPKRTPSPSTFRLR
jgi:hypothetical protein